MFRPVQVLAIASLVGISFAAAGCSKQSTADETPDTSTYRPLATPTTEFEQKLKYVRSANFQYVWVFTRLDGKEFTSEDSQMLRTNAPKVVDWIGLEDKKTYIAGSNFPIEASNLQTLQKRYKIEDMSAARP